MQGRGSVILPPELVRRGAVYVKSKASERELGRHGMRLASDSPGCWFSVGPHVALRLAGRAIFSAAPDEAVKYN